MDYDALLKAVERAGDFPDRAAARDAAESVLSVLGEHLAGKEPSHLAAQLPPEIALALPVVGGAERFDVEEFDRRVASRELRHCSPAQAHRHAIAVLSIVLSMVSEGERDDVIAQLPADFGDFV